MINGLAAGLGLVGAAAFAGRHEIALGTGLRRRYGAWTQKDDRRATRQIKSLNKRMRKAEELALGAAQRGNTKPMLEHFRDAVQFADHMRGVWEEIPIRYRMDKAELAVGADASARGAGGDHPAGPHIDLLVIGQSGSLRRLALDLSEGRGEITIPIDRVNEAILLVRLVPEYEPLCG